MAWITLIIAGFMEIGWPLGLKMAQQSAHYKIVWVIFAIAAIGISDALLFHSQKEIPLGTAYAVWTGIGAVGTLLVGIMFFGDSANVLRLLSASLIVLGIIGLKLF